MLNFKYEISGEKGRRLDYKNIVIRITLFLGFLLFVFPIFSQNFPTGLLDEDEAYDQLERISVHASSKAVLPKKVDLLPYCPRVKNQGDISSCVGWSTGYAAMTIDKAISMGWKDEAVISENAFSAMFVFNHIKEGEDCILGARIVDAIDFLRKKGNLTAAEFDFNVDNCDKKAEPYQFKEAGLNTITDFATLFDRNANDFVKVQQVKRALAGEMTTSKKPKPVVIGMDIRKNFIQLRNAKFWWPDTGNITPAGGHAMTVVGYDDTVGAFRLFNSWGKGWGNLGTIWVKYKDFAKFCKYGYIIYTKEDDSYVQSEPMLAEVEVSNNRQQSTLAPSNSQNARPQANTNRSTSPQKRHNPALPDVRNSGNRPTASIGRTANPETQKRNLRTFEGKFEFRVFEDFSASGTPIFNAAPVTKVDDYYVLKEEAKVGQQFQLWLTTPLERNMYVYVFSVDAANKVQVHWPRKEAYNPKYKGMNESAFVLHHAKLKIPGQSESGNERVLTLEHSGTDHLVVLFSTKKIADFKAICEKMQYRKERFANDLQLLLGNHAIPSADIDYGNEEMSFDVATRSIGYIVPIVLEVHGR